MIPFSKPYTPSSASEHINQALNSLIQQGDGSYSKLIERLVSEKYGASQLFLTPSCTAALELSLMLLDIKAGDEVIIPSFTFTSVATAVTKFWATPVFCDIDTKTGCLDTDSLKELIGPKTKAISWVNYGGIIPEINHLKELSRQFNIPLIEDAAHNFLVLGKGQHEPTGDFVTFSFHATKNFQCGEGGGLLVTNKEYIERAHVMREKGTNRRDFNRGVVSKYSWVDRGSSYLLAEINSALLFAQLDEFEVIQRKRQEIVESYAASLAEFEEINWSVLKGTEHSAHLFALLAPNEQERSFLIKFLLEQDIVAVSHYQDLASSPAGIRYADRNSNCINSQDFASRIVRLPVFFELDFARQEIIVSTIKSFFRGK